VISHNHQGAIWFVLERFHRSKLILCDKVAVKIRNKTTLIEILIRGWGNTKFDNRHIYPPMSEDFSLKKFLDNKNELSAEYEFSAKMGFYQRYRIFVLMYEIIKSFFYSKINEFHKTKFIVRF